MERVIELALELPGELRAFQVAGMDLKYVCVHRRAEAFQVDQNFDGAVCFAC